MDAQPNPSSPAALSRSRGARTRLSRRRRAGATSVLAVAAACVLALAFTAGRPVTGAQGANQARSRGALLLGRTPFGISDANPWTFSDPRIRWLGVRFARLVVPWDAVRHPKAMGQISAWMHAAQIAGIAPLVAFDRGFARPRRLPRVAQYDRAIRAFIRRFSWVRTYQPWNEENQASEPTARHPERAARFLQVLQRACRGCVITAADVLDGPTMGSWLRRFLRRAPHARLWGLHPYYELTYGRRSSVGHHTIRALTSQVRGHVWLTETGQPVWRFLRMGKTFTLASDALQARATRRMLDLVAANRRITRVYFYQWRTRATLADSRAQRRRHRRVTTTWDSGLLRPDCSPRPAFYVVARALGRSARPPGAGRTQHGYACEATRRRR